MGGDVRTTVGVPKLSAFANGSGTPIVIDTATGVGYFTDKNTVVPITGGSAGGVTSVNGETGAVVIDATDVGAVPKTGGIMTGPLQITNIYSGPGSGAIDIAADGVLFFPAMSQQFTQTGYIKLPGGLIIQWGVSSGTGARGVTFTIPFPTAVFSMVAVTKSASGTTGQGFHTTASIDSLAGATVVAMFNNVSSITPAGEDIYWIAFGH